MKYFPKINITGLLLLSYIYLPSLMSQNIDYELLYLQTFFDNLEPNTSLAVGTIAGEASVSNGASNYTIPIKVPPGTNGIEPELSISYNSRSGDGHMGRGWGVSSGSTITRGTRKLLTDGEITPVDLDDDALYLDGIRLIEMGGNTYRKEMYDYTTIESFGNVGGDPEWFKVETKNGVIMEFGRQYNSAFYSDDGTEILFWKLNRILYKDGNYIDYAYSNDFRDHRLTDILYTGNLIANLGTYNSIKINYKNRGVTSNTNYEAGASINSYHLVDNILVKQGSDLVRKYQMTYATDGINAFLQEITEFGDDGTELNPTIFKYGQNNQHFAFEGIGTHPILTEQIITGDFNSDGISDKMVAQLVEEDGKLYHESFDIYENIYDSGNVSFDYKFSETLPHLGLVGNEINTYNFFSSDFNGDGLDDIAYTFSANESMNFREIVGISIYQMQEGMTGMTKVDIPLGLTESNFYAVEDKPVIVGDYNGDGISDMVMHLAVYNCEGCSYDYKSFIYYGNISSQFEELVQIGIAGISINEWHSKEVSSIDINGDGKMELMISAFSESDIYAFDDLNVSSVNGFALNYPTKYHLRFYGDFNGDGKTDILTRGSLSDDTAPWYIGRGNGYKFVEDGSPFVWAGGPPEIDEDYNGQLMLVGDYNGDGKSDIARGRPDDEFNQVIDVYFSKGNEMLRLEYDEAWTENNTNGVQDFNGDGKSEILNTNSANGYSWIRGFNYDKEEFLIQSIKNGLGVQTNFNYARMNSDDFYTRTSLTDHPVNTLMLPIYLVKEMEQEGYWPSSYQYQDAKMHKEGRGMMGFTKIIEGTVTGSDVKLESVSELNTEHFILLPKETNSYVSNGPLMGSNQIGSSSYVNEIKSFVSPVNNMTYFTNHLNSKIDNNILSGTNLNTSYSYDDYGNIELSIIDNSGIETVEVETAFGQHGSSLPASPVHTVTTTTRTGETPFVIEELRSFNDLGQLTQIVLNPSDPKSITTTYTYNDFGQGNSITFSADNEQSRTTNLAFDAKGRFAIGSTNALGQTTVTVYDDKYGTPISKTGIDDLTTTFQYDPFGRLKSTIDPVGNQVTDSYAWATGPDAVYSHALDNEGKGLKVDFFDGNGRVVEMQMSGYSSERKFRTKYDNLGRVIFKETPSGFSSVYTYDEYDRMLTSIDLFNNYSMNYSYVGGNLISTTTNIGTGQSKVNTTDPTGKILNSSDFDGSQIDYTYHSNGNNKEVFFGSTLLTHNEFDDWGRKTKLTDANAGITEYNVDSFGQLVQEITANGDIITSTYNQLGLVTETESPEGITIFSYYSSGGDINKLSQVQSFGGDVETFAYDFYGRMIEKNHTIGSTVFTSTYNYDDFGKVESKTFPSGLKLNYSYNDNGYLETIKDESGAHIIFENIAMTELDQYMTYKSEINGDEQLINISYDHSYPIQIVNGTKNILNYNWDYASGNLLERVTEYQGMNAIDELFEYDNLNRLKTQTIEGSNVATVAFDINGNILNKSDAGSDYLYDANKINAVNCITSPNYSELSIYNQEISYNSFMQPVNVIENDIEETILYGSSYERIKSTLTTPTGTEERYYLGEYETYEDATGLTHLHYVNIGRGVHMIIARKNGNDTYYRAMTDFQGSILYLGDTGTDEYNFNYDGWGRTRDVSDLSYIDSNPGPAFMNRGYTGHEHMDDFQLINMNGRLYDPVVGRMLSPDNNIQDPLNTQNYNRYSYALNNPLKYTDPNGEFIELAWAAVSVVANGVGNLSNNQSFFDGWASAALGGAFSGGYAKAGFGAISKFMPSANIDLGAGFSLNLSPSIAFGTNGFGMGANAQLSFKSEYFNVGSSIGFTDFLQTPGGELNSFEGRFGYGGMLKTGLNKLDNSDNIWGQAIAGFGGTQFFGNKKQRTGYATIGSEKINYTFDNDVKFVAGDTGDRWRSAGNRISIHGVDFGLLMFTGDPGMDKNSQQEKFVHGFGDQKFYDVSKNNDDPNSHRLGALYIGFGNTRIGANSEGIRHLVQNKMIHALTGSHWFEHLGAKFPTRQYGGFYSNNPYTTW